MSIDYCEYCGQELKADHCQVNGCNRKAEYELWWGLGSEGMISKIQVCEVHKQEECARRANVN